MPLVWFSWRMIAALCVAIALCAPASGQPVARSDVAAEQRAFLTEMSRAVDQLESLIGRNAEDDAILVDIRLRLEALPAQVSRSSARLRPRLADVEGRLEQLGSAPADGDEPAIVAEERRALSSERAEINAVLGIAEDLSARITTLIERIAQIRRALFADTLSKRYDIFVALNAQVLSDFATEAGKVYRTVSSWLGFTLRHKFTALLVATLLAWGAAALLTFGGRRLFGELLVADPARPDPPYLNRLSRAFWSTLLPSAALAVFLAASYSLYDHFGVLRDDIRQMMATTFNVVAIVFFVNRLASAVFSPRLANWRLVPIESDAALRLYWLVWTTSIVTGLDFILSRFSTILGSPLSLTIAKSLIATIIVGILVILIAFVKPYRDEGGTPRSWSRPFRYALILLGAATIVPALLGYIGFARFVSQQLVVTGAILATMYIGYLSASAISEVGAFTKTKLGRRLDSRFEFEEATQDQLGLLLGVLIKVLVLAVGIPLILLQWGFQWGDMRAWLFEVSNQITIGTVSISIVGILTGIFVFLLGYFVTRGFQGWLDGTVMSRGKVDAGVRNSIRMAIGYAGIGVAALVGLSVAGINLSNFALIAGALSVGIGFGLQNIVNNFVSGLILLAERPFKVGDWIVAGAVDGTVKKISVRATEIETFQRQTVILPNSELINAAVGNWTHRNRVGRVEVAVGVSKEADPRRIHDLLLGIAREHAMALKNPEPSVLFTGFAGAALNFEVQIFLSDIARGPAVRNEIRFRIFEVLSGEGIEIRS